MTTDLITEKQLNFIRSLRESKDCTTPIDFQKLDPQQANTLANMMVAGDDIFVGTTMADLLEFTDMVFDYCKHCDRGQASLIIGLLLACPDKAQPQSITKPDEPRQTDRDRYPDIPAGRYAITNAFDETDFYIIEVGDVGKWDGFIFVSRLASDTKLPVRGAAKYPILDQIRQDGPAEACKRFGRELGVCGICGKTLTDADSRARGIGPVCMERF